MLVDDDLRDVNVQTLMGPDGCTCTFVGDVDGAATPRLGECLLGLFDRPEVTDVKSNLTGVTFWALPGSGPW